jgi:hypothetical protein
MSKKVLIGIIILGVVWYLLLRNKVSVPSSVKYFGETYKLAKSSKQGTGLVSYYTKEGESVSQFSNLIMLTVWPKSSATSIETFDTNFRQFLERSVGAKSGVDNSSVGGCWFSANINPPQNTYVTYKTTAKYFTQLSLTKVKQQTDSSDPTVSCADYEQVVGDEGLGGIELK